MMRFRSVGTPRCPSREYNNEDNHRKRGGQEKEHKKKQVRDCRELSSPPHRSFSAGGQSGVTCDRGTKSHTRFFFVRIKTYTQQVFIDTL